MHLLSVSWQLLRRHIPTRVIKKMALATTSAAGEEVTVRRVIDPHSWADPSRALHRGARDGDMVAVRAALCSGCDPNERFRGQTALMYAAETGNAEAVAVLLANGAAVDAVDSYGRTALHHACRNKHERCCALLMEAGARTDVECTLGGETPIDVVRARGNPTLVRFVAYYKQNASDISNDVTAAIKAHASEL
jgi:ankyrin repeat protein